MLGVLEATLPLLPGGPAALSDGGGHAGRPGGGGAARGGHVRLRDADPGRAHRAGLHQPGRAEHAECAAHGRCRVRWTRRAAAPLARRHSRAYLHHLFRAKEILGPMLLTQHNVTYYQSLMRGLRSAILAGGLGGPRRRLPGGLGCGRPNAMSDYSVLTQLGAAVEAPANPGRGRAGAGRQSAAGHGLPGAVRLPGVHLAVPADGAAGLRPPGAWTTCRTSGSWRASR